MRQKAIGTLALASLTVYVASPNRIAANPTQIAPARTFSTVSLNLARETDPNKIVKAIQDAPRIREADVYLFQEVCNEMGRSSVADEVARKIGYSVSFAAAAPGVYDQGLAILSRYPISDVEIKRLKASDLHFRSRNRFAIAANVKTPWGDVRIWNVHLDTRINSQERLDQLQPVMDDAARHIGPRLIGGDFNTNDLYWLANLMPLPFGPPHSLRIRKEMRQHNFETPFADNLETFPLFRRHLDWIYLSDLKSVGASSEPAPFSDHNAIWTCVRI